MPSYRVGQKVVCINDDWYDQYRRPITKASPRKGAIYTVSGFKTCNNWPEDVWIQLSEFESSIGFKVVNFRPVIDKTADISVFTKILDEVNGEVGIDA